MTNPTWQERDKPVLTAIVELADEGKNFIYPSDIVERTGLDAQAVEIALRALADAEPPLIRSGESSDYSGSRQILRVSNPSGRARQLAGTWPSPGAIAEEIIDGLNEAAEFEDDENKRGKAKRTAAWLGGAGKDVFADVVAAVIAKQMGV